MQSPEVDVDLTDKDIFKLICVFAFSFNVQKKKFNETSNTLNIFM